MTKIRRKLRKMWEDKTGVSPIIAVILMVAITVVLAATIWAWVSGFGGGGTEPEAAAVVVKGDSNRLRATLSQAGDKMPSGGYTDFGIFVNGTAISGTLPSPWDVGESIIIMANSTTAPLHFGVYDGSTYASDLVTLCKYAVTVEIQGTVVFDKSITVTA